MRNVHNGEILRGNLERRLLIRGSTIPMFIREGHGIRFRPHMCDPERKRRTSRVSDDLDCGFAGSLAALGMTVFQTAALGEITEARIQFEHCSRNILEIGSSQVILVAADFSAPDLK